MFVTFFDIELSKNPLDLQKSEYVVCEAFYVFCFYLCTFIICTNKGLHLHFVVQCTKTIKIYLINSVSWTINSTSCKM